MKNRVSRRIFRPMREEVTGGWEKLHTEELQNLYLIPNIVMTRKCKRICTTRVGASLNVVTFNKKFGYSSSNKNIYIFVSQNFVTMHPVMKTLTGVLIVKIVIFKLLHNTSIL
jgi:hypothetical protein